MHPCLTSMCVAVCKIPFLCDNRRGTLKIPASLEAVIRHGDVYMVVKDSRMER